MTWPRRRAAGPPAPCRPKRLRKLLDAAPPGGPGRPAYWEQLVAQGLVGLHLPEDDGGGGGELLDLAVVLEELGRAALPGPYLPTALAAELLPPRRAPAPRTRPGHR